MLAVANNTCPTCGVEFHPLKGKKYCSQQCGQYQRSKRYKERHPDRVVSQRQRDDANVAQRIYSRVKCRAKRDGITFNLDVDDIIIPEYCPVLGFKLVTNIGKGSGYHWDSASLDKIKPELGYVKGNVRVISSRANLLKNDATVEELEKVLEDLKKIGQV